MFTAILITLAAYWIADEIVTAPLLISDETGHFDHWQKSEYKSLFDYMKKKIFKH